ncbi:MAG: hypothetical protein IPP74_06885 [Alphaproteobacteria bacterium]|nr:hypothetical protein [Alphaproteobacteria bacterium]
MAYKDGVIFIDPIFISKGTKNSTFATVVSLISHEMTHAYQENQVNAVLGGYPQTIPINIDNSDLNNPQTLDAMIFAINASNYSKADSLYFSQPVEIQAYSLQTDLRGIFNKRGY